jgi:hypothetical protein
VLSFVRDGALDDVDELGRRIDPALLPPFDDRLRDPAAEPLFAVFINDPAQIGLREAVYKFFRRQFSFLVHAHIQRSVVTEAEAPLGLVELHRRDAEIEQETVGSFDIRFFKDRF